MKYHDDGKSYVSSIVFCLSKGDEAIVGSATTYTKETNLPLVGPIINQRESADLLLLKGD